MQCFFYTSYIRFIILATTQILLNLRNIRIVSKYRLLSCDIHFASTLFCNFSILLFIYKKNLFLQLLIHSCMPSSQLTSISDHLLFLWSKSCISIFDSHLGYNNDSCDETSLYKSNLMSVSLCVCFFLSSPTLPKRQTPTSWNFEGWFPLGCQWF